MTTTVNATDTRLATTLSAINGEIKGQGTLASLSIRKKGVTRGPSGSKVIYGDDFVHVLLWTGFHYHALVERSFQRLHWLWSQGNFIHKLVQATADAGYTTVSIQDAAEAIQEVDDSFLRILHGVRSRVPADPLAGLLEDDEEEADLSKAPDDLPRSSVWEPLRVNGEMVPGSKVYIGAGDANNPRAPTKGMIYLDGVKLGERVLAPAPNGAWMPKRKPKAVAKDILKSWLPSGLYARYCLDSEAVLSLKIGQNAGEEAKKENIFIDPEALRSLFKIAP